MRGPFDDEEEGFMDGSFGIGMRSDGEEYTRGWLAGSSFEDDDRDEDEDEDDEYYEDRDEDEEDDDDYDYDEDEDDDDF